MFELLDPSTIVLAIIAIIALVGVIIWFYHQNAHRGQDTGSKGHKRVSGVLRSYARLRSFKVLDNVVLPAASGSGTVTIDHVLVGFFGLLFVTDLTLDGDYYGSVKEATWSCTTRQNADGTTLAEKVASLTNPLITNDRAREAALRVFSKNNIYNLRIESMAVAASSASVFYISGGEGKVTPLGKLRQVLDSTRFDLDNGVDVEKIANVLLDASLEK